jgi:hypothetical protein
VKVLTLVCKHCNKRKTVRGVDVGAVIKAIDKAKWHDEPGGKAGGGESVAICPPCWKREEVWLAAQ